MDKPLITPKTKIFDLLEAYPNLEELLISLAPQFRKLKNPVLRKTITKITNLSQAATIAGLNVEEVVNSLRKEAGQEILNSETAEGGIYNTSQPSWFDESNVVKTIDIREMLNDGEQPVHEVMSAIKQLNKYEILKILAPFIPAPLLDKSLSMNYKHWLKEKNNQEFEVFFSKY